MGKLVKFSSRRKKAIRRDSHGMASTIYRFLVCKREDRLALNPRANVRDLDYEIAVFRSALPKDYKE